MSVCECCLSSKLPAHTYPVRELDGTRGDVLLCSDCRAAFRTMTSEAAKRPAGALPSVVGNKRPWQHVVYGGLQVRGRQ